MAKNIFKIIIIFLIGMGGGIFSEQIFWPYFVERPLFYQYGLENPPIYITEQKQVTVQENIALTQAIEKVEQAVAGVKTQKSTGIVLEGSGLIVTSDGLVVTLAELVPQDASSFFFIDGNPENFQLLKRDLKNNLALVKIEKSNLKTAGFANLDDLRLGERVFLVGVVFEKKGISKAVNEGTVRFFDKTRIQTNIAEKYTMAGSPLFNIKGEVLGLNTINAEGRVVAIPISTIKEFVGM
ncbi:MAG: serine protease [bacterium]|nr:serine protease [bacterium]